jgi:hypothetical protein
MILSVEYSLLTNSQNNYWDSFDCEIQSEELEESYYEAKEEERYEERIKAQSLGITKERSDAFKGQAKTQARKG